LRNIRSPYRMSSVRVAIEFPSLIAMQPCFRRKES
jgi:hypothetical protein